MTDRPPYIRAKADTADDPLIVSEYEQGAGYAQAPRVLFIGKRGQIITQAWIVASGDLLSSYPQSMIAAKSDVGRHGSAYVAEAGGNTSYLFIGGQGGYNTFGVDWDGSLLWGNAPIPAVNTAHTWQAKLRRIDDGLMGWDCDVEFENATDGPILEDRTTGTRYRLYVDNGSLGIEAVA